MLFLIIYLSIQPILSLYNATWQSLDTRPIPSWYDEAKFGIFLNWGVFSVPGFGSDEFWQKWALKESNFMEYVYFNNPGHFSYIEFAGQLKAEFFNPNEWVDIVKSSGARYVLINAKSEEGYTLWPSPYSWNWNSVDIGPKRDIIDELFKVIRDQTTLRVGVHYSFEEWFNPFFTRDKQRNFSTSSYIEKKCHPELTDLILTFKPDLLWTSSDDKASENYWKSKEFLAWLYNESPVKDNVVVNDRWGTNTNCRHGGVMTCSEYYITEELYKKKFDVQFQIDKLSWGFRKEAKLDDFYDTKQIIAALVRTVSHGGNFVLNIGPSSEGKISLLQEERLRSVGDWLTINGEGIYGTIPWTSKNDNVNQDIWYTSKGTEIITVYAIALNWPITHKLILGAALPQPTTTVTLLGFNETLPWMTENDKMVIDLQNITRALITTNWAWTFELKSLKTSREHRNNF